MLAFSRQYLCAELGTRHKSVATIGHCFKANKFSPVAVPLNTVPILTPRGEKISYFFVSQKLSYVIAVSTVATLLNNCREPSYCSSRGGNIVCVFFKYIY